MTAESDGLPRGLDVLIPGYLGAQRWFGGSGQPHSDSVRLEHSHTLWADHGDAHRLWHAMVAVEDIHYQLLIGERPLDERADFLHGREEAVLGSVDASLFYDALLDSELARILLEIVSGGTQSAALARPVAAEQSNTSLVFDDRVILKVYRRLHEGPNPDVEVTSALAAAGFEHVARPLVSWREEPYDLAFGQEFLAGGSEGWALALTSLRDFYRSACDDPGQAGGDFSSETRRLGRMTAEMHIALAETFGITNGEAFVGDWYVLIDRIAARLADAVQLAGRDLLASAGPLLDRLRSVPDPGPAIRVHGDYHLGQVMQTDAGWYVLDFEGEPARPLLERMAPMSPLKDVSSMLRSFDYAARYALTEQPATDLPRLTPMAQAWDTHNRQAFLEGYFDLEGIKTLLPGPDRAPAVMIAYELDKALYELDYERAHRPDWVPVPLGAIDYLLYGGE